MKFSGNRLVFRFFLKSFFWMAVWYLLVSRFSKAEVSVHLMSLFPLIPTFNHPVAWVIKRRKDTSLFHSRSDAEAVHQVVVAGNPETLCNIFIYLLILTSALPSQCTVAENHHSFLMMFDGSLSQAVSKLLGVLRPVNQCGCIWARVRLCRSYNSNTLITSTIQCDSAMKNTYHQSILPFQWQLHLSPPQMGQSGRHAENKRNKK